ncbi:MAG: XRE family transcriptional regulator [Gemmatimonadales bacterium]
MARKWDTLKAGMSPAARERADHKTEVLLAALTLRDLLRERGVTQDALARKLEVAQGNVSRLLRRSDLHLSTLREVIESLGGSLEITARFKDQDYRIDQMVGA